MLMNFFPVTNSLERQKMRLIELLKSDGSLGWQGMIGLDSDMQVFLEKWLKLIMC